jgi:hypothetical protein
MQRGNAGKFLRAEASQAQRNWQATVGRVLEDGRLLPEEGADDRPGMSCCTHVPRVHSSSPATSLPAICDKARPEQEQNFALQSDHHSWSGAF